MLEVIVVAWLVVIALALLRIHRTLTTIETLLKQAVKSQPVTKEESTD